MHSDAAIASTVSDPTTADGARIPRIDRDAPEIPAVLVGALREWRASRRARDASRAAHQVTLALVKTLGRMFDEAVERAADADHDAAFLLLRSGPVVQGIWRYSGADVGGLLTVIREPVDFLPDREEEDRPIVAEACVAIDEVA